MNHVIGFLTFRRSLRRPKNLQEMLELRYKTILSMSTKWSG